MCLTTAFARGGVSGVGVAAFVGRQNYLEEHRHQCALAAMGGVQAQCGELQRKSGAVVHGAHSLACQREPGGRRRPGDSP